MRYTSLHWPPVSARQLWQLHVTCFLAKGTLVAQFDITFYNTQYTSTYPGSGPRPTKADQKGIIVEELILKFTLHCVNP